MNMLKIVNNSAKRKNIQNMHTNSERKDKMYKMNPQDLVELVQESLSIGVLDNCNVYEIVFESTK